MAKTETEEERAENIELTPVPRGEYLDRAAEFMQAFREVKPQPVFDWPRYLLLGHAVEVALKAYLLEYRKGAMDKLREKYKHNLEKLLRHAKKKGLRVTAKVEADIKRLNYVHNKYLARYPEFKGLTTAGARPPYKDGIVVISELLPSVERLMEEVRKKAL
jgi:hypothetical protein